MVYCTVEYSVWRVIYIMVKKSQLALGKIYNEKKRLEHSLRVDYLGLLGLSAHFQSLRPV